MQCEEIGRLLKKVGKFCIIGNRIGSDYVLNRIINKPLNRMIKDKVEILKNNVI